MSCKSCENIRQAKTCPWANPPFTFVYIGIVQGNVNYGDIRIYNAADLSEDSSAYIQWFIEENINR
jgi:hypothetical protein